MYYVLGEVVILTLKGVHDESIIGKDMHASGMVDELGLGYLHEV